MIKTDIKFITCPYCNKQFHPSEIFIPTYFFGKPNNIVRNESNEIVSIDGMDMDTKETFCCDNCNKTFHINTKISFTTMMDELDFDTEYERKIQ